MEGHWLLLEQVLGPEGRWHLTHRITFRLLSMIVVGADKFGDI
jgi:hypothetical protein